MTAAALRVSLQPPVSVDEWGKLVDMPGGAWPCGTATASYYNGKTYFGYGDGDGNIRVASYTHANGAITVSPAIVSGIKIDLHSAPSVLIRSSDHKILIAIAPHNTNHMYVAVSTNAEDVTSWGAATDVASTLAGSGRYTYASLVQLSGESGKIYLFYRDQDVIGPPSENLLCYSTSTDGGSTWTAQTVLFKVANAYCMWAVDSDSASRIDIATSDGSVSDGETTASVYHLYYTGGSWFKSDGTSISGSKPYGTSSVTKLYDGSTNGGVRQTPSIVRDAGSGDIYVALVAANSSGWATNPEKYWYAVYTSGAWTAHLIDDTNRLPDGTLLDGLLVIDPIAPARVYVARAVSDSYQMFLYETADGGSTWTATQLTDDAAYGWHNHHPTSIRDATSGLRCLWSGGTTAPYDATALTVLFSCQIRGYPNPVGPL